MKDVINTLIFVDDRVNERLNALDERLNEPEFSITESEAKFWLASLTEIDQTITKIQDKIRPVLEILNDFPPDQTQTPRLP
jgi:uncharacterized coiled-coil protein SlyX